MSEHNRRRCDAQSKLRKMAVHPTVNLATILSVILALVGGGIAWGSLRSDVDATRNVVERHEEEISIAKDRAETASSSATTNRAVLQRMENYMQEMRRDIKTLIRESRDDG